MNRHGRIVRATATWSRLFAAGVLALGLLAAASPAGAASMMQVPRNSWTGGKSLPSYLQMYVYVPDNKAAKPPIIVSAHACGSTASGQIGNITKIRAAADKNGFIIVFPDNPNQNCWDVGTDASLKHDGGGDTNGVALMVKYALTQYSGDPNRVYIHGGSSGAMLTQAMLAVYPDLFRAGSARAGVAAGCWAVSYRTSDQWSDPCQKGTVTKTAMQWGDLVRGMDPGYMGHRPRVQLMHGTSDATIDYKNMGESIKEWTNVLGLSETPTSTEKSYKGAVATWDRQFWKNSCGYTVLEAWSAPGQGHSMLYEEDAILKFFGLDVAGGTDPETDCSGGGGASGTAGTSGGGGSTGAGGTGGGGGAPRDGGTGGSYDAGGPDVGSTGSAGAQGAGGGAGPGVGGTLGTGSGGSGTGVGGSNATGTGGTSASAGTTGSGTGVGGSATGAGGSAPNATGSGGSAPAAGGAESGGCACAVDGAVAQSTSTLGTLLLLAAALVVRRQRRRRD